MFNGLLFGFCYSNIYFVIISEVSDLIDMNMSINELKVGPNEPVMMIAWPWLCIKESVLWSPMKPILFFFISSCAQVLRMYKVQVLRLRLKIITISMKALLKKDT